MVLKELNIKNFRSYYGDDNNYLFKPDGLTLIIGDNGDGKTTFVEALEWLFDTTNIRQKDDILNVSEMQKSRMLVGDENEVRVTIKFNHYGEKELTKAFRFKKVEVNKILLIDREFLGYEYNGIERLQVPGDRLLNACFDAEIRKYSMFKGETQLDIFHQDSEALKRLIKNFSDIKRLDDFSKVTDDLKTKAGLAYSKELSKDKKVAQMAASINSDLKKVRESITNKRKEIKTQEMNSSFYKEKLDKMVDNTEIKDKLDAINERIKNYESDERRYRNTIQIDYNTQLLDAYWILAPYPNILKEFQSKSSALSKEKRIQRDNFLIEKGKQKQLEELTLPEGVAKLPWYMPDEGTMNEMIHDEICKVCGRPAPVGSDPYNFMVKKLNEYIEYKKKQNNTEEEELFKNNYIDELHHLSISFGGVRENDIENLENDIKDRLGLVARITAEVNKTEEAIEQAKDEKSRLLIQLNGASEDDLYKSAQDVRDYMSKRESAQRRLGQLNTELTQLRADETELTQKLNELNPESKEAARFGRIHRIFEEIYYAFETARDTNRDNFLRHLAELSNKYLDKLNVSDFHGVIEIYRHSETENIDVMLKSDNGSYVTNASESQKTTMFMSVLFAIAEITANKREIEYPLIFDAPTSSFSQMKETEFYDVINKLKKQCIIVTKDMLEYNPATRSSSIKPSALELSCPIYRIEKEKGFNPNDLSTIRVITNKIKD